VVATVCSLERGPGFIKGFDHITQQLQLRVLAKGAGAELISAWVQLCYGFAVLGDHQHVATAGHFIHEAEAACLEFAGADLSHCAGIINFLNIERIMVMTMILSI